MFQGAFPYRIDDRGRLKMPAEFVDALGSSFTVTRGNTKGCLWVLPDAEWEPMIERLRGDSLFDQRFLALQRWFIGFAAKTSLDPQGRLTIPPVLREFAGIEHEAMLVGIGNRIEIWSKEGWEAYENQLNGDLIEELARGAGI